MINVVFCIPGRTFSNHFLISWTNLMWACQTYQVNQIVSAAYTNNIYWSRDLCLGGKTDGPSSQKPFEGKGPYDYIMWIDSDMVFNPGQFKILLDKMEGDKKYKVLAGIYPLEDNRYATHFLTNKEDRYLKQEDIESLGDKPLKVWYTGMGFMLVRRGVFEKLKYPWFLPTRYKEKGGAVSVSGDDASFCIRAKKEAKIDIWVDPGVILGHEKSIIL